MTRAFFTDATVLAHVFTPSSFRDVEKQGKYLEGGLKPIEAFCNDIRDNLREWAYTEDSIFYRTKDYWYDFRLAEPTVVMMTRYENGSWRRMDDFANLSSIQDCVGKSWLTANCADKLVPVFVEYKPTMPSRPARGGEL